MSDTESSTNGSTATVENRLPREEAKAKKTPKSKFAAGFNMLRDFDGKGSVTLTRKLEEGTLSLSLKKFPQGQDVDDIVEAAEEVGCKGAAKSSVGEADANFQKTLKEEAAAKWAEFVCS